MKNKTKISLIMKILNFSSYPKKFLWFIAGLVFILDLNALISMAVFQIVSKNKFLGISIFFSALLSVIGAYLFRIPILNKILSKTRGIDFKRKNKKPLLWGLTTQIYIGLGIFLGLVVIVFMALVKDIDVIDPIVYVAIVLISSGVLYFCFLLLRDSFNKFHYKGWKKTNKISPLRKVWVASMFFSWGTLAGIFIGWVISAIVFLI